MNGGGGPFRGPFYEGMLKLAPFLIAAVLGIVLTALVIDWIQERADPQAKHRQFDAVKNISEINTAGMVKVLMTRPNDGMKEVFEQIYKRDIWSGSGPGSKESFTRKYRQFLQGFLSQHQIKSVIDVGCGDWQFSRLINWEGIDYKGYDIVCSVIEGNRKKYIRKNIHFYCADCTKCELPKVDLVIIKDVFQHWSNSEVLNFLPKLNKYKYALIINDYNETNADCKNGGYRPVNINSSPFYLAAREVFKFHDKKVMLLYGVNDGVWDGQKGRPVTGSVEKR